MLAAPSMQAAAHIVAADPPDRGYITVRERLTAGDPRQRRRAPLATPRGTNRSMPSARITNIPAALSYIPQAEFQPAAAYNQYRRELSRGADNRHVPVSRPYSRAIGEMQLAATAAADTAAGAALAAAPRGELSIAEIIAALEGMLGEAVDDAEIDRIKSQLKELRAIQLVAKIAGTTGALSPEAIRTVRAIGAEVQAASSGVTKAAEQHVIDTNLAELARERELGGIRDERRKVERDLSDALAVEAVAADTADAASKVVSTVDKTRRTLEKELKKIEDFGDNVVQKHQDTTNRAEQLLDQLNALKQEQKRPLSKKGKTAPGRQAKERKALKSKISKILSDRARLQKEQEAITEVGQKVYDIKSAAEDELKQARKLEMNLIHDQNQARIDSLNAAVLAKDIVQKHEGYHLTEGAQLPVKPIAPVTSLKRAKKEAVQREAADTLKQLLAAQVQPAATSRLISAAPAAPAAPARTAAASLRGSRPTSRSSEEDLDAAINAGEFIGTSAENLERKYAAPAASSSRSARPIILSNSAPPASVIEQVAASLGIRVRARDGKQRMLNDIWAVDPDMALRINEGRI